eukprot:scaffold363_cov255-Pinguiococcus_pyrenoidosus.AAC.1
MQLGHLDVGHHTCLFDLGGLVARILHLVHGRQGRRLCLRAAHAGKRFHAGVLRPEGSGAKDALGAALQRAEQHVVAALLALGNLFHLHLVLAEREDAVDVVAHDAEVVELLPQVLVNVLEVRVADHALIGQLLQMLALGPDRNLGELDPPLADDHVRVDGLVEEALRLGDALLRLPDDGLLQVLGDALRASKISQDILLRAHVRTHERVDAEVPVGLPRRLDGAQTQHEAVQAGALRVGQVRVLGLDRRPQQLLELLDVLLGILPALLLVHLGPRAGHRVEQSREIANLRLVLLRLVALAAEVRRPEPALLPGDALLFVAHLVKVLQMPRRLEGRDVVLGAEHFPLRREVLLVLVALERGAGPAQEARAVSAGVLPPLFLEQLRHGHRAEGHLPQVVQLRQPPGSPVLLPNLVAEVIEVEEAVGGEVQRVVDAVQEHVGAHLAARQDLGLDEVPVLGAHEVQEHLADELVQSLALELLVYDAHGLVEEVVLRLLKVPGAKLRDAVVLPAEDREDVVQLRHAPGRRPGLARAAAARATAVRARHASAALALPASPPPQVVAGGAAEALGVHAGAERRPDEDVAGARRLLDAVALLLRRRLLELPGDAPDGRVVREAVHVLFGIAHLEHVPRVLAQGGPAAREQVFRGVRERGRRALGLEIDVLRAEADGLFRDGPPHGALLVRAVLPALAADRLPRRLHGLVDHAVEAAGGGLPPDVRRREGVIRGLPAGVDQRAVLALDDAVRVRVGCVLILAALGNRAGHGRVGGVAAPAVRSHGRSALHQFREHVIQAALVHRLAHGLLPGVVERDAPPHAGRDGLRSGGGAGQPPGPDAGEEGDDAGHAVLLGRLDVVRAMVARAGRHAAVHAAGIGGSRRFDAADLPRLLLLEHLALLAAPAGRQHVVLDHLPVVLLAFVVQLGDHLLQEDALDGGLLRVQAKEVDQRGRRRRVHHQREQADDDEEAQHLLAAALLILQVFVPFLLPHFSNFFQHEAHEQREGQAHGSAEAAPGHDEDVLEAQRPAARVEGLEGEVEEPLLGDEVLLGHGARYGEAHVRTARPIHRRVVAAVAVATFPRGPLARGGGHSVAEAEDILGHGDRVLAIQVPEQRVERHDRDEAHQHHHRVQRDALDDDERPAGVDEHRAADQARVAEDQRVREELRRVPDVSCGGLR